MDEAKVLGWFIFFLGCAAGSMVALAYAAWATRHMERQLHAMFKELAMWRKGWQPRGWELEV